jgi:Bardet-Biedl syndrome 1 protein
MQGLGPLFKVKLNVQNTGTKPLFNVPVMLAPSSIYRISPSQILVPALVPGLLYQFEAEVQCMDQNGAADSIRVFICASNNSVVPVLSAIVKMPLSELLEE